MHIDETSLGISLASLVRVSLHKLFEERMGHSTPSNDESLVRVSLHDNYSKNERVSSTLSNDESLVRVSLHDYYSKNGRTSENSERPAVDDG